MGQEARAAAAAGRDSDRILEEEIARLIHKANNVREAVINATAARAPKGAL